MEHPDVLNDIESFFSELKRTHGIEVDAEEATPAEEARTALEHHADTPPAPAITEVEVEETYPGSRHPRRPAPEDVSDEPEPIWDDRPRVYTSRGRETAFFTISALATALHRKTVTIRKWETKGYLPPAQYRSPGEGKKQDRLYTRDQITGLVKIAQEEGLMDPQKKMRIDQTRFPERAHRLFEALTNRST
jgi:hypothetical protein